MSKTPMQTEKQIAKQNAERSASIMLAINLDSAFKLYSFRIIDHTEYVLRTKELVKQFNQNVK